MSYILDALRKSDEERKKRQEQQQRIYSPYSGAGRPTRKNRLTAGLIISASLLMVIFLLGGGWWLSNRQQSILFQPGISTPENVEQVQSRPDQDTRDPREPAPSMTLPQAGPPAKETAPVPEPSVSGISEREMPASDAAESATGQSQEPASTVIPLMAELPFTIQAQLTEMKFSGHAYSPAPELRLIMINNAVAREGEMIEPDLSLQEITENGLIMSYRGTWFRIELF